MAVQQINPIVIEELTKENATVVVDFWAPWCGPCRAFGPTFESVSNDYPEAVFAKVNIDEYSEFAGENSIMSIPTLWIYKDGKRIYAEPGTLSAEELRKLL